MLATRPPICSLWLAILVQVQTLVPQWPDLPLEGLPWERTLAEDKALAKAVLSRKLGVTLAREIGPAETVKSTWATTAAPIQNPVTFTRKPQTFGILVEQSC